ncbi:30S ribosomal protein S12 methylthiotransferase RimO [Coprococcus sp. BIOML-A1]|uniref:30S ribosomal protein S12 methylthiotransferase RimO n=1 Tax=unclassified Coprococcus TaxID=2684943 RepID=UPI00136A0F85|nr:MULTISPECIES: 30S ribosomal protein S12 methylthiotransferase RimO [unclassified Coprococcus]MZK38683.1 30S ribosomal protein S12 methylthiotransferase RimO [Coprococcus sp. BIOML-A1]MZK63708.1 30S ribosomal protein S12 methylthiotransferase RimO [Coprococcus sp. BIOML-A2]
MKVLLISLGCDKNLVDSEVMLGLLNKAGHQLTNDETEADVVVVNTCAFISDAKEESINTIIEMGELKKTGKLKKLIVAGCLSQRYKDEIMKELPEIDVIIGATNYDKIVEAIGTDEESIIDDINYTPRPIAERIVTTNASMAYFKIAEGCNKLCTYCIIPHIRGRYRSMPMDSLIASAEKLASDGIKELVLVAQETTLYGVDLYGEKKLPELLTKLSEIEGIEWIRLLYCYPEEITDELIEVMATNPKICHYVDIPIQHSENAILKRMGRRTSREDIVELVGRLRTAMPDIAIRTTLISGFPGETQELHDGLVDFVDECEFDRLGVFTYSPEEGTPAAEYEDQVDGELAVKWRDEIMELQQEISYEKNQQMIGSPQKVLIEGYLVDDDVYVGRTYRDAPGVDGIVFVSAPYELISGSFVDVKITEANEYDLTGVIVE